MRIMGLDVGEKRIGVSLSDLLGYTAQGLCVIERRKLEYDLTRLREIITEHEVERLVLGMPYNMDGTMGWKAEEVKAFGDLLANEFGLPIDYQDERLSTKAVEGTLIAADVSRKKRRQVVDKLAAVYILQGYLDSKARRQQSRLD
ncbi:MAG: Holliday junction resolvase RuvX [Candidatus Saccharibacteria bacterium]